MLRHFHWLVAYNTWLFQHVFHKKPSVTVKSTPQNNSSSIPVNTCRVLQSYVNRAQLLFEKEPPRTVIQPPCCNVNAGVLEASSKWIGVFKIIAQVVLWQLFAYFWICTVVLTTLNRHMDSVRLEVGVAGEERSKCHTKFSHYYLSQYFVCRFGLIKWTAHRVRVVSNIFTLQATFKHMQCGKERRLGVWYKNIYCARTGSCEDKPGYLQRQQRVFGSWTADGVFIMQSDFLMPLLFT